MTFAELGRLLGVSTNQVWTWHNRRHRNGFPEAVSRNERGAPLFAPGEVTEWHEVYTAPRRPVDMRPIRERMEVIMGRYGVQRGVG